MSAVIKVTSHLSRPVRLFAAALLVGGVVSSGSLAWAAMQSQAADPTPSPLPIEAAKPLDDAADEIRLAFVRLPLAAVLGTLLAFRPRRRSQGARKVVVVQTQIMLAVVGAVIMLVVGNSLSRAFGIVGAAGQIGRASCRERG